MQEKVCPKCGNKPSDRKETVLKDYGRVKSIRVENACIFCRPPKIESR